ncbi:MAG: hypothetical protein ACYCSJ_08405 [Acidimicrobiales bacterium]
MSSQGLGQEEPRWFHSFEEADGHFAETLGQARDAGAEVTGESYWRRELKASAGPARLALDDIGLVPCGSACGAGPD